MNVHNPGTIADHAIVSSETHIVGGAAGWVDTDLSGVLGVDDRRVWVVTAIHLAAGNLGVRTPGDTVDSKYTNQFTRLVHAVAGHLELYRDAVDTYYQISGWIE